MAKAKTQRRISKTPGAGIQDDPDVIIIGEAIMDLLSTEPVVQFAEATSLTVAPGGAPTNVAIALLRQGVTRVAFFGHVGGADPWGRRLYELLQSEGANVSGLKINEMAQTRLAFVETTPRDRKLVGFTKLLCADSQLHPKDLVPAMFTNAHILHFGSILQICIPSLMATEAAIRLAYQEGMLISYDPNIRYPLWESPSICHECILQTLPFVDILKINEDELHGLTGSHDLDEANRLKKEYNLGLLVVTLGDKGAYVVHSSGSRMVPGYSVKAKDPIGAGDAFAAGVLAGLLPHLKRGVCQGKRRQEVLASLTEAQITKIIQRAHAMGALTCTRFGAIPALPTNQEVDEFIEIKSWAGNTKMLKRNRR